MAGAREVIQYPYSKAETVDVEILSARRALDSVPLLLNVIEAAYMRQFENPANPLVAPGTVSARYAATPANCVRYSKRTADHCDPGEHGSGSVIAAVHPARPYRGHYFRAFAKASPALRATDDKFDGCYLNDVVSMVPRVGFGRIAVHAILSRTGQDQNEPLVLEAFEGSPVNDWYESWGLERTTLVGVFRFGEDEDTECETVPQVCYRTPPGAGVGDVIAALEAAHPQLRDAHRSA